MEMLDKFNPKAKTSQIVQGEKYRITVLTSGLIRFEYSEEGKFLDEATTTVINRDLTDVDFSISKRNEYLYLETSKLTLKYDQKFPSAYGLQIKVTSNGAIYNYATGGEGENLGGTSRTLDKVDGTTDIGDGLLSTSGYSVLDDSETVIIGDDGWFKPREDKQVDLYFFAGAKDYQGTLDDFYKISGQTPLLPRYVLGNWWSRFHAYSDEEYKELILKFEEENIPISVAVIDMDWHITDIDPKYGTGWTGYSWNRELFKEPKEFISWLHDKGMKVSLNVHPADGIRAFEDQYEDMAKDMGIDPATEEVVEFDFSDPQFVEAYFKNINDKLEEDGVDFWWLDWQQGTVSKMEGLDPLWPINHYHYLDNAEKNERGLIFSRYAGLGSHRYPVGFSGDTYITWESLDFQPYFTSRATNAAYTWWSHDIGGHMYGYKDTEMIIRWFQLGVYSPIMRLHSTSSSFVHKEPWSFDPTTKEILTASMQLRYKLVPYLYTMNFKTAYENIALIRPLYFSEPDNLMAYQTANEYYFGTELIVMPMTSPVNKTTKVSEFMAWLPNGDFFDFETGRHYVGNKSITLHRDLSSMAVLAKAGAVVPLDNSKEYHNDLRNPENLLLKVFTGADGKFELIEDDGKLARPDKSQVATTEFIFEFNSGKNSTLTITPAKGDTSSLPENRTYKIDLYGVTDTEFEVNGANVINSNYDNLKHCLSLELSDINLKDKVVITYSNTMIVRNEIINSAYEILDKMDIQYLQKDYLFNLIKGKGLNRDSLSSMYALVDNKYITPELAKQFGELDRKVIDVLAELFYAASENE